MDRSERGSEVIKGTLEMIVLQVLQRGPMHGWGITVTSVAAAGARVPRFMRLLRDGMPSIAPYTSRRPGVRGKPHVRSRQKWSEEYTASALLFLHGDPRIQLSGAMRG